MDTKYIFFSILTNPQMQMTNSLKAQNITDSSCARIYKGRKYKIKYSIVHRSNDHKTFWQYGLILGHV